MAYMIRQLLESDIEAESFFATLSNLRPVGNLSFELAHEIFVDCEKKGIETYVAVEGGQVIGTLRILFEPKYYHAGRFAAHIEDVVTHQAWQGKGVARQLIEHAVRLCREKDCYKIILDCASEFVGFYEKFGFKQTDLGMRLNLDI
jgi:glucosamine-phosphate N-acetyltransferase